MAKKNFSGGLDSLFGSSLPTDNKAQTEQEAAAKSDSGKGKELKEDNVPHFGLADSKVEKLQFVADSKKVPLEKLIEEAVDFYLYFQVELDEQWQQDREQ